MPYDTTQTARPATMAFQKVVAQVSAIIPPDFPPDDDHWRPTFASHDAFMDAVRACESHDTPSNRERVRVTAKAWRQAWEQAVADWRDEQICASVAALV